MDAERISGAQAPLLLPPDSKDGALWLRTYYQRLKHARQLRVTLSQTRGVSGVLRRQIVVFQVGSHRRKREASFELPPLNSSILVAQKIEAVVEQSFEAAQRLLSAGTSN